MQKDPFTGRIIGCAIEVHRTLGPGLLESAYQQCLAYEFRKAALAFQLEHSVPVHYKEVLIDCGFRIDVFFPDRLILELKSVREIEDIHRAQILTYMKLTGIQTGLLINFNVLRLSNGIERFKL